MFEVWNDHFVTRSLLSPLVKEFWQKTYLSLTNRATHLCKMQWPGWPLKTRRSSYVLLLLRRPRIIRFRCSLLCWFRAIHGTAPTYLQSCFTRLSDVTSRQRMRSSASQRLAMPPVRLTTVGKRAFPVSGAIVWNSLPPLVTSAPSLAIFRHCLKTFLFAQSYPDIHIWVEFAPMMDLAIINIIQATLTIMMMMMMMMTMCYHAKFGRSALKGVGINTGEPHKLGRAGTPLSWYGRHAWPQDTRPSPTCVTTPNMVVLRQMVYA